MPGSMSRRHAPRSATYWTRHAVRFLRTVMHHIVGAPDDYALLRARGDEDLWQEINVQPLVLKLVLIAHASCVLELPDCPFPFSMGPEESAATRRAHFRRPLRDIRHSCGIAWGASPSVSPRTQRTVALFLPRLDHSRLPASPRVAGLVARGFRSRVLRRAPCQTSKEAHCGIIVRSPCFIATVGRASVRLATWPT